MSVTTKTVVHYSAWFVGVWTLFCFGKYQKQKMEVQNR